MESTRLYTFLLSLVMLGSSLQAQQLSQRVSLDYSNERLGYVLTDISTVYDVRFSYSSDFIPVDQRVSIRIDNQPLSIALDDLFGTTSVQYKTIGGQVVLRRAHNKPQQLSQTSLPRKVKQTSPIHQEPADPNTLAIAKRKQIMMRNRPEKLEPIQKSSLHELPGGDSMIELDLEQYKIAFDELDLEEEEEDDTRFAQISILPYVGTNALKSNEVTNNVSVNLFWGTNGGVAGVEVGGFVNTVVNDVYGMQIAGMGNMVGGEVIGTQIGFLFNYCKGRTQGLQASGLFNVTGSGDAVQFAGLFNSARGDFSGLQAAGLLNRSKGSSGVQIAGLNNISSGDTKTQISGLFNVAKDVESGQVSALLNVGKKVSGFQIGLINISDTISGTPIGLLNIVKHGYNRVELSSQEALIANFQLKLGARSFYNIFHFGARWDDVNVMTGNNQEEGNSVMTWGLGYGFGTTVTLGTRSLVNLELMSIHINEKEAWTNTLNLLNQFKLLFDYRIGKRTSIFLGPTYNAMFSKLEDPETGVIGSNISPYSFYNQTFENDNSTTNLQMWVGLNAGIRF